ncbi:Tir chaperone protein (CesT) family protein [Succinivibrio dextrinosolvens]|uniref:type III secretion system chaperone n=1 Tax=Succinivibrio dextrinosolvens TaxID=83771 RepID=UPI0008F231B7|nr:type III secretion system chaperone [Succinivibrio dextrinosolvens]SFS48271.1 Tir chaperone protein (CesT) family protein [Succinivibrio dextrinosolvens]
MSLTQAKLLFSDMTKTLKIGEGTFNDQGMCRIVLKDEWMPPINFCYLDSTDEILIFSAIGIIEGKKEPEVFKALFYRQFLFDKSNSITYALAPDNNALTAQVKLHVSVLTVDDFADAVEKFANEVAYLRVTYFSKDDNVTDSGYQQDVLDIASGLMG